MCDKPRKTQGNHSKERRLKHMATIQEQARRFLAAHNMDPEGICLKTNTERFLQEMEDG